MKKMNMKKSMLAIVALLACLIAPTAHAALIGTVPTNPGDTVFPGLVPAGTNPGTLLASLTVPFVSSLGNTAGTMVSTVYREAGGTLDFYYQVTNNTTAPNCGHAGQPGCDPIARETDTSFTGFLTAVGFRVDGASLTGGVFVNGTAAPTTADRNSVGDVVGFSFTPGSANIQPGQTSFVLVISTDATNFAAGNASVIDGGVTTVASFEPTGSVSRTPEPASLLLLGGGLVALISMRRLRA
jgi:PEP-CTERM motif